MVQRVLAAKSIAHARAGCVLAGYLKLLPPLLFVLPGMAARVLFGAELAADVARAREVRGREPAGGARV